MAHTYDHSGRHSIKKFSHVKIRHPRHSCFGMTGTVVNVEHPRVWVALSDGRVVPANHRSLEVILPRNLRTA